MRCGCNRQVPGTVVQAALQTGKRLVCTICGARSMPFNKVCEGCEQCDGEGGCRLLPNGRHPLVDKLDEDFERQRDDEARSLYSDWVDQTF